mgnify:CR=1 FL=1
MRRWFKIVIIAIILLGSFTIVYAAERLVDIPVPPDNHGMADFTEEEAEQQSKEYEENKNNTTADDYIGKSVNNYLKSLNVEGYELEPEFIGENDTYTIYVKDRSNVISLNITAEADDETAKVEGTGQVEITPDQKSVTIQVTAENGNLKIYTINIEDEENKDNSASISTDVIVGIGLVVIIILFGIIIAINKKKSGKKLNK